MTRAMRALGNVLLAAALTACGGVSHAPVEPAQLPPAPPPSAPEPRPPLPPPVDPLTSCTAGDVHFTDARLAPQPLTEEQERAITDVDRFVHEHRGAQDREMRKQVAEQELHRAHTYFDAKHWGEAAVAFRSVAMSHTDADAGVYSMTLFLESLSMLGAAEPHRPVCYDVMARDVPVLLRLYCEDEPHPDVERASACVRLRKIQRDFDRLAAQKLVQEADQLDAGDPVLYERAGELFLSLARRCITEAHAAHAAPTDERCDEVAYNAGRAFLAAKKTDRAKDAAQLMTDPASGMKSSPLTAKLVYLVNQP